MPSRKSLIAGFQASERDQRTMRRGNTLKPIQFRAKCKKSKTRVRSRSPQASKGRENEGEVDEELEDGKRPKVA